MSPASRLVAACLTLAVLLSSFASTGAPATPAGAQASPTSGASADRVAAASEPVQAPAPGSADPPSGGFAPGSPEATTAAPSLTATSRPAVAVSPAPIAIAPSPNAGASPLAALLARLAVAPEQRTGYDRALFVLWIDADSNRCDTRKEVLIAEAIEAPIVGANCVISGGRWHSLYDGIETTDPGTFDVDHVVPLAEAWDSGASAWTADRRKAYANDLGAPWSLIAVSASSNRSKGDSDPREWLPPLASVRCTYTAMWLEVKVRWGLAVDALERDLLADLVAACPGTPGEVQLAN